MKRTTILVGSSLLLLATMPRVEAVTAFVGAELLKNADGTAMIPNTGLMLIVIDTAQNGFSVPTPGHFVSGDDVIVTRSALIGNFLPGCLLIQSDFGIGTNGISSGDPIGMFFYPTLSINSPTPNFLDPYGFITNPNAYVSAGYNSDAWRVPNDNGATLSLNYFSTDAVNAVLPGDGNYDPFTTQAHYQVVPEVSVAWPALLAAGAFLSFRRRRSQA